MSLIMHMLEEERDRLEEYIADRQAELKGFPKGSLHVKKLYNQSYLYRVFREGEKVVWQYLGKDAPKIRKKIEAELKERKKIAALLKKAQSNLLEAKRAIDRI